MARRGRPLPPRRWRWWSVEIGFGLAMLVVVGRAAQIQLVQGRSWRDFAEDQRTEQRILEPRRGTLYDRRGAPLALTLDRYHVGIAPNELNRRDRSAVVDLLARSLEVPRTRIERGLTRRWFYLHGPFSAAQVEPIRLLRGVYPELILQRFYPDPRFAPGVLGRAPTEGRGASGIERLMDSVLTGKAGEAVVLKDRGGRAYESPGRVITRPVPGGDVYLTLDYELQDIAQRALADAMAQTRSMSGDVVVLDPESGEVLAAESRGRDRARRAAVFTEVFEPGSTAKVFAAAALLEKGLVQEHESVDGEGGRWSLGYRVIHDDHPLDRVSLAQAIQLSSNIGIAKFAARLSRQEQYLGLRSFGFGSPTGVEMPVESPGLLKAPNRWSRATPQSLAIGYGFAVTPIQLAQAYAAIANGGRLIQPALIKEVRSHDGRVVYRHRPLVVRQVMSPEVAAKLRGLLRAVVSEGTGIELEMSQYPVGGKSGTVWRFSQGRYKPGAYTATFVSIFPADSAQLVVLVKLDEPQGSYYAGAVAAPLARTLLEQALASPTPALDRARLAPAPVEPRVAAPDGTGSVSFVVRWPPVASPAPDTTLRRVPRLAGMSMREAVFALHRRGFRVRLQGWGIVRGTEPEVGGRAAPGSVVTIHAAQTRE